MMMLGPPPGLPRPGGEATEVWGSGDERMQQSLLPLPVPDWCRDAGGGSKGRSARRRRGNRALQGDLMTELVVALNQLDAGPDDPPARAVQEPNRMQQLCLEYLADSCAALGSPPSDLSTEVALRELQVGAGFGDGEPVTVAPFAHDLVALPAAGGVAVPL